MLGLVLPDGWKSFYEKKQFKRGKKGKGKSRFSNSGNKHFTFIREFELGNDDSSEKLPTVDAEMKETFRRLLQN